MCDPREFENWGLLIRPGSPGDVFRMLHGLNCRFANQPCCIICDSADVPNIPKLIAENPTKVNENACWSLLNTGDLYWLALSGLKPRKGVEANIAEFLDKWKKCFSKPIAFGARHIWTSFSDARAKQSGHKDRLPGNIQRVDCAGASLLFPSQTAKFGGIPDYAPGIDDPLRVAVVLRGNQKGHRDSPAYHHDETFLTTGLGDGREIAFEFFGYSEDGDSRWPAWGTHRPFVNVPLIDQIRYAQTFHLAMGVNSSALDVFSIAGVPVLRECEFQAVMKKGWPFKRRYNAFLGGNINLGLGIYREARGSHSWHDAERLSTYFRLLLESSPWTLKPEWGSAPKHIYVGPTFNYERVASRVHDLCGVE